VAARCCGGGARGAALQLRCAAQGVARARRARRARAAPAQQHATGTPAALLSMVGALLVPRHA
jgi:hypothetical protein